MNCRPRSANRKDADNSFTAPRRQRVKAAARFSPSPAGEQKTPSIAVERDSTEQPPEFSVADFEYAWYFEDLYNGADTVSARFIVMTA